jgi:hypothetical protein
VKTSINTKSYNNLSSHKNSEIYVRANVAIIEFIVIFGGIKDRNEEFKL